MATSAVTELAVAPSLPPTIDESSSSASITPQSSPEQSTSNGTFYQRFKRRMSDSRAGAGAAAILAMSTPSMPTSVRHFGDKLRNKLDDNNGEGTSRSGSPTLPSLKAQTIRPTSHRENTALHVLIDSLPAIPTLTAPSFPSISVRTPSFAGLMGWLGTDATDDELELEGGSNEQPREPSPSPGSSGSAFKRVQGNVVVLGGFKGSVLRDAKTNRRLWLPLRVGLNIRRPDLSLGLADEDEARAQETVVPGRMLMQIAGFLDLGKGLKEKLKALDSSSEASALGKKPKPRVRFHNWGYDWRLSLDKSSDEFLAFVEGLYEESKARGDGQDGQGEGATVIAHSMGGLVALGALAKATNPKVFAGIVFAGTPLGGCVNMLGPLRKGDSIVFNRSISAPSAIFSMRSPFYFLPESGECFETPEGEKINVDFFDSRSWSDYALSPATAGLFDQDTAEKASVRERRKREAETASEIFDLDGGMDGGADPGAGFEVGNGAEGEQPALEPSSPPSPVTRTFSRELPSDGRIAEYLDRSLLRARKYRQLLQSGFDESKKASYPPLCILTSRRTATVRGVLVPDRDSIATDTYEHLLFGEGDGIVEYKSAVSLPGGWGELLKGVEESSYGHVSLFADLPAIAACLDRILPQAP